MYKRATACVSVCHAGCGFDDEWGHGADCLHLLGPMTTRRLRCAFRQPSGALSNERELGGPKSVVNWEATERRGEEQRKLRGERVGVIGVRRPGG
jgi:hypothetical protein